MKNLLEARQISKSYGALKVLNNVSFTAQKEEIVAIVGKSGAGKSTLLHILGTLDRPDNGQLLIGQKSPFSLSAKKLADFRNQSIGFVFQFHHLLEEFSALENVLLPTFIHSNGATARQKAKYLLDIMGLSDRITHRPSQLSGGEQQRVAIARALINDPEIIFADEPSGNLDAKTSEGIHQLFLTLRQELKQTFILVTHNHELAQMSDRIVEMIDGRINS